MDSDSDGLNDAAERTLGTDPKKRDTDGDGLSDGAEVKLGTNPLKKDTDGDGEIDPEDTDPLHPPADLAVTDIVLVGRDRVQCSYQNLGQGYATSVYIAISFSDRVVREDHPGDIGPGQSGALLTDPLDLPLGWFNVRCRANTRYDMNTRNNIMDRSLAGRTVVYDLIAQAGKAEWQTGEGKVYLGGPYVLWLEHQAMEDGKTYPLVLYTLPAPAHQGVVTGLFSDLYDTGYVVEVQDEFVLLAGFPQGLPGDAGFFVAIVHEDGGYTWIVNSADTQDGRLLSLRVPLSTWAGQRLRGFILEVSANGSVEWSQAGWVIARIER